MEIGTRNLSLFCAKVGAKHVYAMECSHMADMEKECVWINEYSDVITTLKGKVKEVELLVVHVDVISMDVWGHAKNNTLWM